MRHHPLIQLAASLALFAAGAGDTWGADASGGFRPVTNPPIPQIAVSPWPTRDLDRFVFSGLQSAGLQPSPAAEPATLLRRVCLDLVGLPPDRDERTASPAKLVADSGDPDANYRDLVERLLATPHFGERWASVWLDAARYADSQGYEKDNLRTIWSYRDWVIQAFNDDLPFDQFTTEQLAGDLLPHPTTRQLVATAFHRNTMTNTEGGVSAEEFRVKAVIDRVNTTWQTWLGVNFQCAQCHDHPDEPISQHDYYAFLAFFNNTEDANEPDDRPLLTLHPLSQESQIKALREKRDAFVDADRKAEAAELDRQIAEIPETTVPILRELPPEKARPTSLFHRGNWLEPGEAVEPATPAALPKLPAGSPHNRLGLARWIVSPENPLTARVMVNRIWAQLFGQGLAPENAFGTHGATIAQRDLLDHLAFRFSHELGWSVKALLREIVLSSTYRQSSHLTPELRARDPENRLLARAGRFQLPAETVRDQALATAGLLSPKMYGRSVMPPQPEGVWQVVYNVQRWIPSRGEDFDRRSLYTFWRRTSPFPALASLGVPTRENCTTQRAPAFTPTSALTLLNDDTMARCSAALGHRMASECAAADPDSHLSYAHQLLFGTPPSEATLAILHSLYQQAREKLSSDEAAYSIAATVLYNLESTITHE